MTAYLKPSLFSNPSLPTIPSLSSFGRSASPNPGKLPYDLSPDPGSAPHPSTAGAAGQPRAIMPLFTASSAKNAAAGAWKGLSNSIGVASGRDDEEGTTRAGRPAARHDVARESSSVGARIKCSDCGVEVALDELLDHVCAPTTAGYRTAAAAQKPTSPPRQQIRVEIPRQREFSGAQSSSPSSATSG